MLKLYDQTTFSDPKAGTHGDCHRACTCTLLQIDPTPLPHPITSEGEWNGGWFKALREIGYVIRSINVTMDTVAIERIVDQGWGDFEVPRLVMAAGRTERGVRHAVVYDRAAKRIVHDPHPSRAGLLDIEAFDYLAPFPPPKN